MLKWRNRLLNNNTLFWRQNDLTVFLLMFIVFFSIAFIIMIYTYSPYLEKCITDYWVMPMGIGFVIVIPFAVLAWILTCSVRFGERMCDDLDGVKK